MKNEKYEKFIHSIPQNEYIIYLTKYDYNFSPFSHCIRILNFHRVLLVL